MLYGAHSAAQRPACIRCVVSRCFVPLKNQRVLHRDGSSHGAMDSAADGRPEHVTLTTAKGLKPFLKQHSIIFTWPSFIMARCLTPRQLPLCLRPVIFLSQAVVLRKPSPSLLKRCCLFPATTLMQHISHVRRQPTQLPFTNSSA